MNTYEVVNNPRRQKMYFSTVIMKTRLFKYIKKFYNQRRKIVR